ncbi:hypothetical protein C8Q79DRAFT_967395 [Trametes meyenii]|nr:hypothetical protein C8Q79DRAFT_967395 [Trametes meyenii]
MSSIPSPPSPIACFAVNEDGTPCTCTKFKKKSSKSSRCKKCRHLREHHRDSSDSTWAEVFGAGGHSAHPASTQTKPATISDVIATHMRASGLSNLNLTRANQVGEFVLGNSAVVGSANWQSGSEPFQGSPSKASDAEARAEMLQGFRPHKANPPQMTAQSMSQPRIASGSQGKGHGHQKAHGATAKAPGTRKGKGKGKAEPEPEKLTPVGAVVFIPGGLYKAPDRESDDHLALQLRNPTYLTIDQEEDLTAHGLLITEYPPQSGKHPAFNPKWASEAVDIWARLLAPDLFRYLDARFGELRGPGPEDFHWHFLRREHNKVFLVRRKVPITGADLLRVRGSGRSVNSYKLYFALRHKMRPAVYTNLETATQNALRGVFDADSDESDSDISESSDSESSSAFDKSSYHDVKNSDHEGDDDNSDSDNFLEDYDFRRAKSDSPAPSNPGPWTRAKSMAQSPKDFNVSPPVAGPSSIGFTSTQRRKRARSSSLDIATVESEVLPLKRVRLFEPSPTPEPGEDDVIANYLSSTGDTVLAMGPATAAPPGPVMATAGQAAAATTTTTPTADRLDPTAAGSPDSEVSADVYSDDYWKARASRGLKSPGKLKRDVWASK